MKHALIFLVLFFSFTLNAQNVPSKPLVVGQQLTLESKILNQERVINVYLPTSYSPDSTKKYPVIYLLDGSMNEDLIHVSGITQFLSFPWFDFMPEAIVVGISNVDRKHDFTFPTTIEKDKKAFPTTGGSQKFIEFLEKELQPMIENQFPVSEDKTIIGQSLGGLLASEILIKNPEMFTRYIIISPSLWWNDLSLLNENFKKSDSIQTVFIGVGKEGKVMQSSAKKLYKNVDKLYGNHADVHFQFFKKYNHANIMHQAIYNALITVFE